MRLFETAAVVAEALDQAGAAPVVVGALALSHWTDGFVVADRIELAVPASEAADRSLGELGIEAHDGGWRVPVHAIRISRARDGLDPDQATATVELPSGRTLALLSPEDVLLELGAFVATGEPELGAFVATGEPEAAGEAVAMLDASPLNVVWLDERASGAFLGRNVVTAAGRACSAPTIAMWPPRVVGGAANSGLCGSRARFRR